jgi:hypothetical protein
LECAGDITVSAPVNAWNNSNSLTLGTAGGNITTGNLNSFSEQVREGISTSLVLEEQVRSTQLLEYLNSYSKAGNGGAIALSTAGGNITTGRRSEFLL